MEQGDQSVRLVTDWSLWCRGNLKEVTVRSYLFLLAEDVITLYLNDIYDMMILYDSPSEYSISIGIMWHTQHCSKVMHLITQITLLL